MRWAGPHAPRLPHLVLGLLFIALAGWYLLDALSGARFGPATAWPALLVGLGVAGLLAFLPREGR